MNAQINLPDNLLTVEQFNCLMLKLDAMDRKIDRLQPAQFTDDWLNGTNFCKKYNISRPTLYRKTQSGLVEVQTLDGIKRYRMKEGA